MKHAAAFTKNQLHNHKYHPRKGANERRERFKAEYLATNQGTESARRAGYKNPASRASKLLQNPVIAAELAAKREEKLTELDATSNKVLRETVRIAFLDPRLFFDEDGSFKVISQLDADSAAAISTVEVKEGRITKLRFVSKVQALDLLGKYLRLWDGASSNPKDKLQEIVLALREK